ncbi:MAG: CvpA family protein [Bacteroidetes bacterium]|nr:CvpA family protein [Bacteroidota bacterium]
MTFADWVIAGFIVIGIISGAFKGFWKQIFSLAGLLFGYFLAVRFGAGADSFIAGYFPSITAFSPFTGMITVFLLVQISVKLAAAQLEKSEFLGLTPFLNSVLGAVTGGAKSAFALITLDIFLYLLSMPSPDVIRQSRFYPVVREVTQTVSDTFNIKDTVEKLLP